ncbi:MAG: hypothetical protein ACE5K8_06960 [Candidatus Zixiibacteriota bacterium]
MKERYFRIKGLMRLQSIAWYAFLGFFLSATALFFFESPAADHIANWGIVVIFGLTLTKIIILSEQFRAARLYRFWLLSYLLVVIVLSTVLLKMYLV